MIKRILMVAVTGAAILLNTTTTVILGAVTFAAAQKIIVVVDELSAERAETARARISALQIAPHADQPPGEISKTRNLAGQVTPYHRMILRKGVR